MATEVLTAIPCDECGLGIATHKLTACNLCDACYAIQMEIALRAIVARVQGEYDHPILVGKGPLQSFKEDIHRFAASALDLRMLYGWEENYG
jgi:protein-arginine kinase activator protein McsA